MRNSQKITWMHLPEKREKEPRTAALPQSARWAALAETAPEWKRCEYIAQATAWEEEQTAATRAFEMKYERWCSPLARA